MKGKDSVYVVSWPEFGVFKIGYSSVNRWSRFVSSGAEVVAVWQFDSSTDAFHIESWLQKIADETHEPARLSAADAAFLLGNKGAGRLECYRGATDDARNVINEAMRRAMLDADASEEVRA